MNRLIDPLIEIVKKSEKLCHPFLVLNEGQIYLNDNNLALSINTELEFITRDRIRLFFVEKIATSNIFRRAIDLKSISYNIEDENCILSTQENSLNEIGILNLQTYQLILFKSFLKTNTDMKFKLELKYSPESYIERIMRRNYYEN